MADEMSNVELERERKLLPTADIITGWNDAQKRRETKKMTPFSHDMQEMNSALRSLCDALTRSRR